METTNQQIVSCRLRRQFSFYETHPVNAVAQMGALQAQDLNMARLALAMRTNTTVSGITALLKSKELVRAHILRPTWHIVTMSDYRRMNKLTAPYIRKVLVGYCKNEGISLEELIKCGAILSKLFNDKPVASREFISTELGHHNIRNGSIPTSMVLMFYELEQMLIQDFSEPAGNNYCLLPQSAENNHSNEIEDALWLAMKYFSIHGPASMQDFRWWSGLPATICNKIENEISNQLNSVHHRNTKLYFVGDLEPTVSHDPILIPAYDEMIIAYTDRSHVIPDEHLRKIVTSNGIFRPVVLENNEVTAIWKKTSAKSKHSFSYDKIVPGFDPSKLLNAEKSLIGRLS